MALTTAALRVYSYQHYRPQQQNNSGIIHQELIRTNIESSRIMLYVPQTIQKHTRCLGSISNVRLRSISIEYRYHTMYRANTRRHARHAAEREHERERAYLHPMGDFSHLGTRYCFCMHHAFGLVLSRTVQTSAIRPLSRCSKIDFQPVRRNSFDLKNRAVPSHHTIPMHQVPYNSLQGLTSSPPNTTAAAVAKACARQRG